MKAPKKPGKEKGPDVSRKRSDGHTPLVAVTDVSPYGDWCRVRVGASTFPVSYMSDPLPDLAGMALALIAGETDSARVYLDGEDSGCAWVQVRGGHLVFGNCGDDGATDLGAVGEHAGRDIVRGLFDAYLGDLDAWSLWEWHMDGRDDPDAPSAYGLRLAQSNLIGVMAALATETTDDKDDAMGKMAKVLETDWEAMRERLFGSD